ncbi:MAG: protein kinase [Planctomycetota bacterium]
MSAAGAVPPPRRPGQAEGASQVPMPPGQLGDLPATIGRGKRRTSMDTDVALSGSDVRTMADSGGRSTGRHGSHGTGPRRGSQENLASSIDHNVSISSESVRKYRFHDELGRGGLGVVHLAEDMGLRRELAIKVLRDPRDPNAVADFIEEAQITGQLSHPNIVPVYELGQDPQGRPFMAMKLVGGRTMQEICSFVERKKGKSNLAALLRDRRLELFQKVCDAIGYAHSRGVIHRDIKPENVMVGEFGEVLVMDWGLARPIGVGQQRQRVVNTDLRETHRTDVTMVGDVFGTPAYMAPEQANGHTDAIDERTDIFALGGMLYELLTLQPPYGGRTVDEVLTRARRGKVIPPRRRAPHMEIPRELEAIVMRAMATDPRQRYRKVSDLRDDIDAYLANEPGTAWNDGLLTRLMKWGKRNPGRAMGAVMSAALVLVTGTVFLVATAWVGEAENAKLALQAQADVREAEREAERKAQQAAELEAKRKAQRDEDDQRRREVEQRRKDEQARKDAEQARKDAEEEAERAHIKALLQQGQLDELRKRLGIQAQDKAKVVVEEFQRKWDEAEAAGKSSRQFFDELDQALIHSYIDAIESLVRESDAQKKDLHTPNQLVYCGLLYYMGLSDPRKGVEWFTRAIDMKNDLEWAWGNRGYARWAMHDLKGAEADLARALELDPNDPGTKSALASVRRELASGSGGTFEERLAANPDDANALGERADWRWNNGQREAAIEDIRRVTELLPDDVRGWRLLANWTATLNRHEESVKAFRRVVAIEPASDSSWVNLANELRFIEDYAGAVEAATFAIKANPKNWRAFVNRGWAHRSLQQRERAIEDLKTAWNMTDDTSWKRQLADDLRKLGSPVE